MTGIHCFTHSDSTVRSSSRFLRRLFILCLMPLLTALFFIPSAADAAPGRATDARPSKDGQLQVSGTGLVNENGETVTVRGFSTHGLSWYPDYVNADLFRDLSENWGADIVRLAMYSEDYVVNRQQNLEILHRGIEAAIQADMYVLVDWHILNDCDPMQNVGAARAFFEDISAEYANDPHILYEICNEPNSGTTWESIYEYANIIIPIIRSHSPKAVIIVGTPNYDQDLQSPYDKPIDDPNTMYAFHFYTTSHHDSMFMTLEHAIRAGLPVFITECGITEASGDGDIDYEYAVKWFDFLHESNISYVVWNLSNKRETSSFIRASSPETTHLHEEDLTECGKWIRFLLMGMEPSDIPAGKVRDSYSFTDQLLIQVNSISTADGIPVRSWIYIAPSCALVLLVVALMRLYVRRRTAKRCGTYGDFISACGDPSLSGRSPSKTLPKHALIYTFLFFSMVYLVWRILFSINNRAGWLPIVCNVALLITEVVGFFESCIHYGNLMDVSKHPLPKIAKEDYPDVDIFIATYNEPEDLLMRTINGCKHLHYPDPSRIHIWVCDDSRRPAIRKLAEDMGVGYSDRPDNKGAKAGNLNHAMSLTHAPYVVTLDADMIVQSNFLMETIPYFVYTEQCNKELPEDKQRHLGLLQTPQCFYDADVFQFALYSERNIPNEQDFFYRTIEVGKSSTNSVIYGGSNTVLSRAALNAVGGFYQGSITEDFATGMLIEGAGYLSLALPTPYASGRTPNTFVEHIQQRTRWGRGVINTARRLHLLTRRDLSLSQRLSYISSVIYWYSPIKNLIYILSPLMFAVFSVPVFRCTWIDLFVYWLPMFLLQDVCLRVLGKNSISLKWSAIYEISVMPYLIIPIIRETLGMSLTKFKVTDKSGKRRSRKDDAPLMIPFIILIILTVAGIGRVLLFAVHVHSLSLIIILFWLVRNLYSFIMVIFLINGRDADETSESVIVHDGELVLVTRQRDQAVFEGITTRLTEHSVNAFLDEPDDLRIGDTIQLQINTMKYEAVLTGIVTGMRSLRDTGQVVCTIEILDFRGQQEIYLQILYDRIPTLPQSLQKDFGVMSLFWRNIVNRLIRTI